MSNKDPLSLIESRALEGEREDNLLVHACHSILPILYPSQFFLSFFSPPFLSQCLLICCDFLLEIAITIFVIMMTPIVHGKVPLYNVCHDRILLFQPLTTFVWFGCPWRSLTDVLVTQPPPFTCAGHATKQRRVFCLFACRDTFICYGVNALFLPIPRRMHLVVTTHPYFLQVVRYPNRIFSPKKPEQEPQNRFFLLPTARSCPLTFDS